MTYDEREQKVIEAIQKTRDYVRKTYQVDFMPGIQMEQIEDNGVMKLQQWAVFTLVDLNKEEE
jgi:hypothetical protein